MIAFIIALNSYTDGAAIQDAAQRQQLEGYFAWQAAGVADAASVPTDICDALSGVSGVMSSGAVISSESTSSPSRPGARYELLSVTPGYLKFLWPSTDVVATTGLVAGAAFAIELGLVPGSDVVLLNTQGEARLERIAAVMEPSSRSSAADRQIFSVTAPIGTSSSCFIDTRPGASSAVGQLIPGWFPASAGVVSVPYLVDDVRTSEPAQDMLETRSSQLYWFYGSIALLVLAGLMTLLRRSDFALYSLLGAQPAQLFVMLLTDLVTTIFFPAIGMVLIATLMIDGQAKELGIITATDDISRFFCLLLLAPALAFLVVQPWRSLTILRES